MHFLKVFCNIFGIFCFIESFITIRQKRILDSEIPTTLAIPDLRDRGTFSQAILGQGMTICTGTKKNPTKDIRLTGIEIKVFI